MSEVRLEHVSRTYDRVTAVDDVSLTVAEGQFLTLLGPSGCGKTTTLRMIAGFLQPTAGTIYIKGEDVTRVSANRRDTGMVFQTYALFPHMSVAANVAFGLKMRGIRGEAAAVRVRDALRVVQLESMADRLPRQLSGGQQQRVALARAVVIRPQVLLMDEPLGSLDLKLRQELQIQIRSVQQELGITAIYVTHDQGEALSMSDRVAVMRNGRVEQLDQPDRLYSRPVNAFVANFVGRTNLLAVEVIEVFAAQSSCKVRSTDAPDLAFSVAIADADRAWRPGDRCLLGFRPENGVLGSTAENRIGARVRDVRYFGATRSVALTNALGGSLDIDVPSGNPIPARGESTEISWRPNGCFLLPREDS
ncbi:MAG: ABC transporter ATP-binding protein [Alphaproteobacteria bacterium]|nr:ABC transporter ATP-binding protein [Alphaproteobacteria bacterium]